MGMIFLRLSSGFSMVRVGRVTTLLKVHVISVRSNTYFRKGCVSTTTTIGGGLWRLDATIGWLTTARQHRIYQRWQGISQQYCDCR